MLSLSCYIYDKEKLLYNLDTKCQLYKTHFSTSLAKMPNELKYLSQPNFKRLVKNLRVRLNVVRLMYSPSPLEKAAELFYKYYTKLEKLGHGQQDKTWAKLSTLDSAICKLSILGVIN
jgi:hypothetical protein